VQILQKMQVFIIKNIMMSENTINLDDFNVIDFYRRFKNLNRIYLFNTLNEINLWSYGKNKNDFSITFDGLTKVGNLLSSIIINDKHEKMLNEFFINILINDNIGYALPIFKFNNKIYTKTNNVKNINLTDYNNIKNFFSELSNSDIIIIFNVKLINDSLSISYDSLNNLFCGEK
jgi:hypothetical protein